MTNNRIMSYDIIRSLPTDDIEPTPIEMEIVNQIFKQRKSTFSKFLEDLKEPLIVGALFILFNLPYISNIIISVIPLTTNSSMILLIVKTIAIMILFWFLKYTTDNNNNSSRF